MLNIKNKILFINLIFYSSNIFYVLFKGYVQTLFVVLYNLVNN